MSRRIAEIQETIAGAFNTMPGVFSTVQWGGRAYKVGDSRKFKLLAHLSLSEDGKAVGIDFKLTKARAREACDQFDWVSPHSFRTLAPSGWVSATVRTKTQCKAVIKLLMESRSLHPVDVPPAAASTLTNKQAEAYEIAQRIGRVVREKKAEGWSPRRDDESDWQ